MPYAYETDGAAIYAESFATIRAEADLARFDPDEERVTVRMIHAAGLVGLEAHVRFTPGMVAAARAALQSGAPILCDARMVSEGITRKRLPADNPVICTLHDAEVPALAARLSTTRSAAALELWRPHLAGAVVAIGNAPTALFHLLEMLEDPACPRPAAIIGCPVGFVGAAESKAALWEAQPAPCVIVEGRLGGSAITVAASTPSRAPPNEPRHDLGRGPRPRQPGPDERPRRPAGARRHPRRLLPQGGPRGPGAHDRGGDAEAGRHRDRHGIPRDDRDRGGGPGLCRLPVGLLRRNRRAPPRHRGGRTGRRRPLRGRPVLLRLLHAPPFAAPRPRSCPRRPRHHRHVGLLDRDGHPDHLGRRRADGPSGDHARGRACPPHGRRRRHRGDEDRAQPPQGPRGAHHRRKARPRLARRMRQHGGRARGAPDEAGEATVPYFSIVIVHGQGRRP
jgi:precorrin-8X/cobalt-precorrin-8 methylmutase